jgi:hypothetical protein
MTGVALYLHQDKRGSVLKILTYEYIIVSVGSVITWINLGNLWTRFPWFGMGSPFFLLQRSAFTEFR